MTGSGNRAANTILGVKCFNSMFSAGSLMTCEKAVTRWGNRLISVVDTPGILDICRSDGIVKRESLKLSGPGPHVFLLVFTIGQFTEDQDYIECLQELFGPEVYQYMMVLCIYEACFEDMTMDEYYKCRDFQRVVNKCGNRFHVLNNRHQFVDLIQKIDIMVAENGGRYYTDSKTGAVRGLQDVASAIKNLQRAVNNVSGIASCQVTFNVNLVPTDTNSSHIVRGRDREVCLPTAGLQRLCVQDSSVQILFDIRSSFIEGISGPVLKSLLDKLFEKKVLTDSERESADEIQSRGDKARIVIDTVRMKGEAASSEMMEFLCEVDPFLCEHLGLI